MTTVLSAFFLVAGASICLVAALGVLRLPDFFLRMHAATKAGVAGAGLVLIGVAFAEPSVGMWAKVCIAVVFLLITTPVAGHLLARAGYVAGVPLWGGTYQDELEGKLPRGEFETRSPRRHEAADATFARPRPGTVIVALTSGPEGEAAVEVALNIAAATGTPLTALAIVDADMLANVGPVPIGGNHYAAQLRRTQIEKARHALAETVQEFERRAERAGVSFSIAMDEGDPVKIIRSRAGASSAIIVAREGWFDHGIAGGRSDPLRYLVRRGIYPLVSVAASGTDVRSISFLHDGTPHSDRTLEWVLERDPWPAATVHLFPGAATREAEIAGATARASAVLGARLADGGSAGIDIVSSHVVVFGNEGHDRWVNMMRASTRARLDDIPVVIFG